MTYAIVASEPVAGEVGGAVQTHFFNAGAVVLWPEAGTGVVATMAMAETAYGRLGLHLMRCGRDVVALGNMLAREGTWDRMVDAYQTATGPFAARLLAALEAGEQAGGDIRGKQSASAKSNPARSFPILIARALGASGRKWKYKAPS